MEAEASTGAALPETLAAGRGRAIPTFMPDERAIHAISRIERALARIEAAAQEVPAAADGELEELRQRHQALRERVEGAVSQIDHMLATRGA